jgi:FlaA1/EpsC-like NDP-sugar epimerase
MGPILQNNRRVIAEAMGLAIIAMGLACAFEVRFEVQMAPLYWDMLARALPWAMGVKLLVFRGFGLRHLGWRHIGFEDLVRIAAAQATGSLLSFLVLRSVIGTLLPRSVYVLDFLLCLLLEVATRSVVRMLANGGRLDGSRSASGSSGRSHEIRRTLIYGAGVAGVRVLAELRANPNLGYQVEGFIDDNAAKRSMRIHGLRVLGARGDLADIARRRKIDQVVIALSTATGAELTAILEECHAAQLTVKRIPAFSEQLEDKVLVDQIREVRLEDLLGRPPAHLDDETVRERIAGQVVLVTGAGGSIGSELCRQIARYRPAALVGLDHAETALYEIEQELASTFPELRFHPEVASIQSLRRLNEVFALYRPSAVYHAAAYKHVPMMEAHLFEAVANNVFGTRNVARAAASWGVADLVLISSDKAVRPTNVMGATKRVAELVCLGEAARGARPRKRTAAGVPYSRRDRPPETHRIRPTNTVAVRFGNVLGSNGSVIPRFRQQIAHGGPITVTHPEMRRYFMTIPEAAQLVLQAGAMGSGGEIFVLDMGEPVRILDLARKMVLLSGLRPDADIPIVFTGLRPGEKMFEELSAYEENTAPTPHHQIRVFNGPKLGAANLAHSLLHLRTTLRARDTGGTVMCLKELVPDYNPSGVLLSRALLPPLRSVRARRAKAERAQKARALGARA